VIASHLVNLTVFSALVSTVFATLLRDTTEDRVRFFLKLFFGFVVGAVVAGWVMAPFPS
jgi:uncharacterized membrane protein YgaE (UPF0421/DUF939 family)